MQRRWLIGIVPTEFALSRSRWVNEEDGRLHGRTHRCHAQKRYDDTPESENSSGTLTRVDAPREAPVTERSDRKWNAPPSVIAEEDIRRLLSNGTSSREDVVAAFVTKASRLVVQLLLEAEQADFLSGRGRYERRRISQRGSRNGYQPARLRTLEGPITVQVPQVRNTSDHFRPDVLKSVDGNSASLNSAVLSLFALVLPTEAVRSNRHEHDRTRWPSPLLENQAIDRLENSCQTLLKRDLSDLALNELSCEALFLSSDRRGDSEALLFAWCAEPSKRKRPLHLVIADPHLRGAWRSLFEDLSERGLRVPTSLSTSRTPRSISILAESVLANTELAS